MVKEAGYYRDSIDPKNVLKCSGESITCAAADTADICNNSNNGKIITTNYNAVVCIDGKSGTVQRFSGTTDYSTSSVYGTVTDYFKVKVSKDSIILDKTGSKCFLEITILLLFKNFIIIIIKNFG